MPQKIKVGFYIHNALYPEIDCRFPELGNPGIGGTQFSELTIAQSLQKVYSDRLEIVLFAHYTRLLPPNLTSYSVDNVIQAAIRSEEEGCTIFIFRTAFLDKSFYDVLCNLKVKLIARSDDFPSTKMLDLMAKCTQIKRHVCVGQEELDLYRDHRVFEKSTKIFHGLNFDIYKPNDNIEKQGNTVVYMGSLSIAKGFHALARVWPKILLQRPDAKLIAIGSGQLYDRSSQLGRWGVADRDYEETYLIPFLSEGNGQVHKSVHFVGLLGSEKISLLQCADVGVVNPMGYTETFCISAIEIQACGTPVVSAARDGLLDTVSHGKTGLLGKTDKELIDNILYFLNNPAIAQQYGKNGIEFVNKKFALLEIVSEWFQLLQDIDCDRSMMIQPIQQNYFYRLKFLKEMLRLAKHYFPVLGIIPHLEIFKFKKQVKEILRRSV